MLVSPDAPDEVWVHFIAIEGEGFRSLDPGGTVMFEFIAVPGGQDGYRYQATLVSKTYG